MRIEVLVIALVAGGMNYLFRYLPLRLHTLYIRQARHKHIVTILLNTIGITSICALVVVSCMPQILADHHQLLPAIIGFAVSGVTFWKTRSIVLPTLLSSLTYGVIWKISMLP
ncbi:L-valine transporter subunit YgaH [Enterobacteriaceae bacterium ESL0689]|nr:L-valine transporter subunit YgaH [Enterobacteriaceae bacterium ESL0689]